MSLVQEFKDFINRGNVMDLAVGVIIGGAFGKIIDSFVGDIIMPIIGSVIGKPDYSALVVGPVKLGSFLNALIGFLILAFVVFMMVKAVNKLMPKKEAPPAGPSETDLLTDIRDLLKSRP
ncbi:MAG: large conductance mechanosensitive channel protein MscL [Armatimonadetes bacterium]|nr:large conductance mechanosensitive channel protein MscL [Armatimonadota bacterium]